MRWTPRSVGSVRLRRDRRDIEPIDTRGRTRWAWDFLFGTVRWIAGHARNAYTAFGLFLVAGAAVAIACTWAFTQIAGHVRSGATQRFDDAVMHFVAAHQYPLLESFMIEVTMLGTGLVVTVIVLIAGMFLWLNQHKHSALLLLAATVGGIGLNWLLKAGFSRPRPQIFEWGTHALSSSFPSGHAMSSAIVYSTVAYLAARLQRNHGSRILTMSFAALLVALICASRLYLGVHYPSDVLAGVTIGLAWAGFCMAVLEMTQLYARRNAPEMLKDEKPAAKTELAESAPVAAAAAGVGAALPDGPRAS
jgi:undecaprenyl-diphosphatase